LYKNETCIGSCSGRLLEWAIILDDYITISGVSKLGCRT